MKNIYVHMSGFELVKQNRFAKNSENCEGKCSRRRKMFAKYVEKFANILWKVRRV